MDGFWSGAVGAVGAVGALEQCAANVRMCRQFVLLVALQVVFSFLKVFLFSGS